MKRKVFLALALIWPAMTQAQTAGAAGLAPMSDAVRNVMQRMAVLLPAAADDMPVSKFNYRPTPAQLSFGGVLVHLAGGNEFLCSSVAGTKAPDEPKPSATDTTAAGWASYGPKAVEHLKRSFEYCTTALAKVDDSKLTDQVPWFGGPNSKTSRAMALLALPMDWEDHYSQLAIYLRINGILPPSARPKPKS
jgi:hypothetical protein